MLSVKEAKKIGIWACIEKIGLDFCREHKDNSVSAWGKREGNKVNCFVGVNDAPPPDPDKMKIRLSSGNDWPYYAFCDVYRETGEIEFGECVLPER